MARSGNDADPALTLQLGPEQLVIRRRYETASILAASLALFRARGYRDFGVYPDYYEDAMAALRLEKRLTPHLPRDLTRVTF